MRSKKFLLLLFPVTFLVSTVFSSERAESQDQSISSPVIGTDDTSGHNLYTQALASLKRISKERGFSAKGAASDGGERFVFKKLLKRFQEVVSGTGLKTTESSVVPDTDSELLKAVDLLTRAAGFDHPKALYALAEIYLFSPYGHPRDVSKAREYLEKLAVLTGQAEAHHLLGHIYAIGLDGNKADPALAMLYHSFAARSGHYASQMVLGYRHLNGIGAPRSCSRALHYYHLAAQRVIEKYLTGPPGGLTLPKETVRLSEFEGGVFGEKTKFRKGKGRESQEQEVEDIIEYYRYLAHGNNLDAIFMLGETYYMGTRTLPKDFPKSLRYLRKLEEKLKGLGAPKDWAKAYQEIGARAYSLLGRMYLRGEGVGSSNSTALEYFTKAAELGNEEGMYWLGMFVLDNPKSTTAAKEEAFNNLIKAAESKHAEANAQLGIHYQKIGMYEESHKHLLFSARLGSLLGSYHLAQYYTKGGHVAESCAVATTLYKLVAEKGIWNYDHSALAYQHHRSGEIETAVIHYTMAAEMGIEAAQANVAWLIDQGKSYMPTINGALGVQGDGHMPNHRLALMYWTRSANQETSESRVKQGDYYYYGLGTTTLANHTKPDYGKAASCYQYAAEKHHNPLAMWNIGWMHENGVGVPLDYHLAKRWYDTSLLHNEHATLPVNLSLIKLGAKYLLSYLMGKKEGEGLISFLQPNQPGLIKSADSKKESSTGSGDSAHTKKDSSGEKGESNPVSWNKKKNKPKEENEDEWSDALPYQRLRTQHATGESDSDDHEGYGFPEDEDSVFDNYLILGLCLFVGWLVYVRQFGVVDNPAANQPAPAAAPAGNVPNPMPVPGQP